MDERIFYSQLRRGQPPDIDALIAVRTITDAAFALLLPAQ